MNLFSDLSNVVSIANKIKNGEISKINSKEIQSAIDTYKKIRNSGYGQTASVILKNTPIGKPVREWYKENVPMNLRMLARGVENTIPSNKVNTWTEKDMTPNEIAQARAVVRDAQVYPKINPNKGIVEQNKFDYFNYDPSNYKFFKNRENKTLSELVNRSFQNPNYAFMQGIGSGEIRYDNKGNPHIIDTYDFNKYGQEHTAYGTAHKLAEDNIKEFAVNINTNPDNYNYPEAIYNTFMPNVENDNLSNVTREQLYNSFLSEYLR